MVILSLSLSLFHSLYPSSSFLLSDLICIIFSSPLFSPLYVSEAIIILPTFPSLSLPLPHYSLSTLFRSSSPCVRGHSVPRYFDWPCALCMLIPMCVSLTPMSPNHKPPSTSEHSQFSPAARWYRDNVTYLLTAQTTF